MVIFKDFSRHLSVFPVLFKANLIFKDFSRQSCIFKYFSSLCEPCPDHISLRNVLIPGAGTVLDPRGLIDMIYVGDHKALLHTKYISFGPHDFREAFLEILPL